MNSNKLLLVLFLFSISLLSCSISQNIPETQVAKYSVEGQLTQTTQYCGGMAPTPEMEREFNTPKPYQTKLYIRKGKENSESATIYDSVVTDGLGKFQISLPAGDYVIILPSQRKKEIIDTYLKMQGQYLEVDEACLRTWWKTGLFQITVVDKNITQLDYNFFNSCFVPTYSTCFNYTGPYPP